MKLDAHQHFWRLDRGDYGWLTPELGAIHRDFGPEDLRPLLRQGGIEATILVQAAPTEAETRYLLGIAEATDFVRGVVGWADLGARAAPERIAALAGEPALLGLRPMIQDIADDDWMLAPGLAPAFAAIEAAGLTFDALVLPRHLPRLRGLLQRHPGLRTVIDHGAKPDIAGGDLAAWKAEMARLARETGAFCKLSGLVTEAAADWTPADLRPAVDHLLEVFGPDRLIWGSDWPVCTLRAGYGQWLAVTEALLADLDATGRAAIMGGTARRAYLLAE